MKNNFFILFNVFFIILFVNCLNENDKLFSKNINNISNNNININNNDLYKNILKNNITKYLNNNNDNIKNKKFNSENIINLNKNGNESDSNENNGDSNENSDSEEDKYLKCFPNKNYFIFTIIIIGIIIIFVIFVSIFKYCPKNDNFEDEIQISFTEMNKEKNDKILFNDK
jgi:hypothetical protein